MEGQSAADTMLEVGVAATFRGRRIGLGRRMAFDFCITEGVSFESALVKVKGVEEMEGLLLTMKVE